MTRQALKGLALACISGGASGFVSPSYSTTNVQKRQPLERKKTTTALFVMGLESRFTTELDIAEDAQRDLFAFDRWATEYGVQRSDGFKLVEEDKFGLTQGKEVYASTTVDASKGTPVLYVPESLILSSSKAVAELRHHGMEEAERYLSSVGAESQVRKDDFVPPSYFLMHSADPSFLEFVVRPYSSGTTI